MNKRISRPLYFALLGALALAVSVVFLELSLRGGTAGRHAEAEADAHVQYSWRTVRNDYKPFVRSELHPRYWFMMRLDPAQLDAKNNRVISMTPEGFRGAGPDARNGRRLAFVLGGSTAFGNGASGDERTLSGYLNCLQDRFHFVNAAHPSWVVQQEMLRIVYQLQDHSPALVLSYSGFNDALSTYRMPDQPPGTNENFPRLVAAVNATGKASEDGALAKAFRGALPNVSKLVDGWSKKRKRSVADPGSISPKTLSNEEKAAASALGKAAARNFLKVQEAARSLVAQVGGVHLVAIQPFYLADARNRSLKDTIGPRNHPDFVSTIAGWHDRYPGMTETYEAFESAIRQSVGDARWLVSQSGTFPAWAQRQGGDLDLGDFYVDVVHLADLGAYVAALDIVQRLLIPNGLVPAPLKNRCPAPPPLEMP